jgi:hypothetical protein
MAYEEENASIDAKLHKEAEERLPHFMLRLIEPYRLTAYWFEIFECLRKVLIVGLPAFFYRGSVEQVLLGQFATVATMSMFLVVRPLQFEGDNVQSVAAQVQILSVLLLSVLIQVGGDAQTMDNVDTILMAMGFISVAMLFHEELSYPFRVGSRYLWEKTKSCVLGMLRMIPAFRRYEKFLATPYEGRHKSGMMGRMMHKMSTKMKLPFARPQQDVASTSRSSRDSKGNDPSDTAGPLPPVFLGDCALTELLRKVESKRTDPAVDWQLRIALEDYKPEQELMEEFDREERALAAWEAYYNAAIEVLKYKARAEIPPEEFTKTLKLGQPPKLPPSSLTKLSGMMNLSDAKKPAAAAPLLPAVAEQRELMEVEASLGSPATTERPPSDRGKSFKIPAGESPDVQPRITETSERNSFSEPSNLSSPWKRADSIGEESTQKRGAAEAALKTSCFCPPPQKMPSQESVKRVLVKTATRKYNGFDQAQTLEELGHRISMAAIAQGRREAVREERMLTRKASRASMSEGSSPNQSALERARESRRASRVSRLSQGSAGGGAYPNLVAVARQDWSAEGQPDGVYLDFKKGMRIEVVKRGEPAGWWLGRLDGKKGWFPVSYCHLQEEQVGIKTAQFL